MTQIEVLRHYGKKITDNPSSFLFVPMASECLRAGKNKMALEILQKGLLRHPSLESAQTLKGRALAALGRNDEAIETLLRVAQTNRENVLARKLLARIYEGYGETQKVSTFLNELHEIWPEYFAGAIEEEKPAVEETAVAAEEETPEPTDAEMGLHMVEDIFEQAIQAETDSKIMAEEFPLRDSEEEAGRRVAEIIFEQRVHEESLRPSAEELKAEMAAAHVKEEAAPEPTDAEMGLHMVEDVFEQPTQGEPARVDETPHAFEEVQVIYEPPADADVPPLVEPIAEPEEPQAVQPPKNPAVETLEKWLGNATRMMKG